MGPPPSSVIRQARHLTKQGKRYAIIQLSLLSTRNPDPADWMDLWQGADVVWSYYDLPLQGNFYHAPLGADPSIFYRRNVGRPYVIGMTGVNKHTECLYECKRAANQLMRPFKHIQNVSDDVLNLYSNSCLYIYGLRHKEGFELPAAEALYCGARPVMFDMPCYRQWFDGLAEFIPLTSSSGVIDSLVDLFYRPWREVSLAEGSEPRRRFDWRAITAGFWERVL